MVSGFAAAAAGWADRLSESSYDRWKGKMTQFFIKDFMSGLKQIEEHNQFRDFTLRFQLQFEKTCSRFDEF